MAFNADVRAMAFCNPYFYLLFGIVMNAFPMELEILRYSKSQSSNHYSLLLLLFFLVNWFF